MNIWQLNAFENQKDMGYAMDIWEAWFWIPASIQYSPAKSVVGREVIVRGE